MHPQKFTVGDGYITIHQYGCLTLQLSGTQQSSVKYQFYIHFRNNYQLGRKGSSTRSPIGSSPLDPTGWLLCPRNYVSSCCTHSVAIGDRPECKDRVVFGAGKRPRRRKKGPTVVHTDVLQRLR